MNNFEAQKAMLLLVANALGPELLTEMTFVGGCTTALLVTDAVTKESIRSTEDVDLIVSVQTNIEYRKLIEILKGKGFREPTPEDGDHPVCAMMLHDLRVDFMPDIESVLSFTNIWYQAAMRTGIDYPLNEEVSIKVISPPYFLATKLEAHKGRGADILSSKDLEDIVNLVDGRRELIHEITKEHSQLKAYIQAELTQLLSEPDFEYLLQGSIFDIDRQRIVYDRFIALSSLNQ